MRIDELTLVSVDDHVVEPADLFDRHLPDRWRDQAPRVVRAPNDDEVRMIGFENACRHFRFDPFAHRSPEHCTVGALRAEAEGVDITVRSAGAPVRRPERPVRISDIAVMSGARE